MRKEYWDERYIAGGSSGQGSIGESRAWKHRVMAKYFDITKETIIDYGVGDMQFHKLSRPKHLIGFDGSKFIIERNREKYPEYVFHYTGDFLPSDFSRFHSDYVLCYDMLFHILNEDEFREVLERLCIMSDKHLFLNSWFRNPFSGWSFLWTSVCNFFWDRKTEKFFEAMKTFVGSKTTDEHYQAYRKFSDYSEIFQQNNMRLSFTSRKGINKLWVFQRMSHEQV